MAMQRKITVESAEIKTATVELKTIQVDNKRMTLSVFKQIPLAPLLVVEGDNVVLNGIPWGLVNYRGPNEGTVGDGCLHVLWQDGKELKRSLELPAIAHPALINPAPTQHLVNALTVRSARLKAAAAMLKLVIAPPAPTIAPQTGAPVIAPLLPEEPQCYVFKDFSPELISRIISGNLALVGEGSPYHRASVECLVNLLPIKYNEPESTLIPQPTPTLDCYGKPVTPTPQIRRGRTPILPTLEETTHAKSVFDHQGLSFMRMIETADNEVAAAQKLVDLFTQGYQDKFNALAAMDQIFIAA